MGKPLSTDLRKRIVADVNGGNSRRGAAARFGVALVGGGELGVAFRVQRLDALHVESYRVREKNSDQSPESPLENNPAYEARNAIQQRSISKEMEPEYVADKTEQTNLRKQPTAKNKAPKGEAQRTDAVRENGPGRRSTGNSKKAKTSSVRKSPEARATKTTRNR